MNIKLVKSGECIAVNDSYGERMIQQGKAVFADETPVKREAQQTAKKAEAANARKETAGKGAGEG